MRLHRKPKKEEVARLWKIGMAMEQIDARWRHREDRNSITKKGQGQYEVERSMLDEQLEDLTKLSRQARVIPHYVKGKTQGFKIVGVRPNSLYSALGIRSGDILKGVNGEQITSPTKALEFLEALKTTSQVTIDIERRNQKKTFEYEIK